MTYILIPGEHTLTAFNIYSISLTLCFEFWFCRFLAMDDTPVVMRRAGLVNIVPTKG